MGKGRAAEEGGVSVMRRGWDEIRRQAKRFADEWQDAHYEKGETQSFYNDFFDIFGVKRRQVASYERRWRRVAAAATAR